MKHLFRELILSLFSFLFAVSNPNNADAQTTELIEQSDIIVCGSVQSRFGPWSHDLGTEHYLVQIRIDTLLKQNFLVDSNLINIDWVVLNSECPENPTELCIQKYDSGQWIFFLNQNHFHGGQELPDDHIFPCNPSIQSSVRNHELKSVRNVDLYGHDNVCPKGCKLCKAIDAYNIKGIEKELKRITIKDQSADLSRHRNIVWALKDREMLATLPTIFFTGVSLLTSDGPKEIGLMYQMGYVKHPVMIGRLFPGLSTHYEDVDTIIFQRTISEETFAETQRNAIYLMLEKQRMEKHMHSSRWETMYGTPPPISDELVLLASAFEGRLELYDYQKEQADYLNIVKKYIDTLAVHRSIYRLSVLAGHSLPEIGTYGLQTLANMDDPRCIPFLIDYARHAYATVPQEPNNEQIRYMDQLVKTIDALTRTSINYHQTMVENPILEINVEDRIKIWQTRFEILPVSSSPSE